jgi:hypothetical protein
MGYRVKGEGRSCGIERQARKNERQYDRENRQANRQAEREIKRDERIAARDAKKEAKSIPKQRSGGSTPAWQRKEGKNPAGGLNAKGVASYRRANPGSKLKTAVTTKPSKLKKGSKAASRRKSFCARMSGMKKRLTSAKTANDPNSRINKSLRKWNC